MFACIRLSSFSNAQVWSRGGNHGGHIVWDAANHSPARKSSTASSGTEPPKPHLGTIVEHTSLQSALYNRLQVWRMCVFFYSAVFVDSRFKGVTFPEGVAVCHLGTVLLLSLLY
jgi:hypothetical protein